MTPPDTVEQAANFMGRIPDDEVSEQTNLKLLGRCDMPTLPLILKESWNTLVEHIWTSSLFGTVRKSIHEFPKTFGTCFALQAFFCLQLSQIQAPRSTGHVLYKRWGSV